ncbi:hypothetical protein K438DRAFT_445168 [Mycena galopus ATCC 62051]|nr:hypothetical protein K438DRAFT_445168 [Mycena galopus ATCC 62051]
MPFSNTVSMSILTPYHNLPVCTRPGVVRTDFRRRFRGCHPGLTAWLVLSHRTRRQKRKSTQETRRLKKSIPIQVDYSIHFVDLLDPSVLTQFLVGDFIGVSNFVPSVRSYGLPCEYIRDCMAPSALSTSENPPVPWKHRRRWRACRRGAKGQRAEDGALEVAVEQAFPENEWGLPGKRNQSGPGGGTEACCTPRTQPECARKEDPGLAPMQRAIPARKKKSWEAFAGHGGRIIFRT